MISWLWRWTCWSLRTASFPAWVEWILHWTWARRMSPGRVLFLLARRWVRNRPLPMSMEHVGRMAAYHELDLVIRFRHTIEVLPGAMYQTNEKEPIEVYPDRPHVLPLILYKGMWFRMSIQPSRDPHVATIILIRNGKVHASLVRTNDDLLMAIEFLRQDLPGHDVTDPAPPPPDPPWYREPDPLPPAPPAIMNRNPLGKRKPR